MNILIVGQGIAGSVLALYLREAGINVYLTDPLSQPGATRVSAGVVNPIVPKKFTEAWGAESAILELNLFFKRFEESYEIKVYEHFPLFLALADTAHLNTWSTLGQESAASRWLLKPQKATPIGISAQYGGVWFDNTGRLDAPLFLDSVKEIFEKEGRYFSKKYIMPGSLDKEETINFEGINFENIVLCEGFPSDGHQILNNAYKPAQGDILLIRLPGLHLKAIIVSDIYLVPLYDDVYLAGSTYIWDINWIPSENAKDELTQKITKLTGLHPDILNHSCQVRPASIDRKPVLGETGIPRHYILSGLGARGIMLAPWLAKTMTNYLLHNAEISPEINSYRFLKGRQKPVQII